jgi:hypothetical protein
MRFFLITVLLATVALTSGCTKIRQFDRFFLSECAEDGPNPEKEFDIALPPVDLSEHLDRLRQEAAGFSLNTIAEVPYRDRVWPIYLASKSGSKGGKRLLIIAGVHGNEVAGALAAPSILSDVRAYPEIYGGLHLDLIGPANPVGLLHGARYNAQGCDINRDFANFATIEARAIREVIDETRPDLILSLHEGPHDGFFVIATRSTPSLLAEAVAAELKSSGIELATHSNLGSRLSVPGVMEEGWFITGAKTVLRISSLGAYAHQSSTPFLTTEGPWGLSDIDYRVRAQILAVRAAAKQLVSGASRLGTFSAGAEVQEASYNVLSVN